MKLSDKKLTKSEKELILKELKESTGFTDYKKEELDYFVNKNQLLIFRNNKKELVGIIIYEFFDKKWAEIRAILVLKKFRGKGYGKKFLKRTIKKLKNKKFYVMSFDGLAKNLFIRENFSKINYLEFPWPLMKYLLRERLKWYKVRALLAKKETRFKDLEHFIYN